MLQLRQLLRPITTMKIEFAELCNDRAPDTADWIFTDPNFVEWDEDIAKPSPVLLIHGPPGSGKSVMAANIVRHLSRRIDPVRLCLTPFAVTMTKNMI